jgi:homeobox protein cut-like
MESMIQERVSQKENELNAAYDEKMRNYEERYVEPSQRATHCLFLGKERKTCSVR